MDLLIVVTCNESTKSLCLFLLNLTCRSSEFAGEDERRACLSD
ncbi:unnamed protein product [Arabidopsis halleri]